MDMIPRLQQCLRQNTDKDAVSAYTPVKMEVAPSCIVDADESRDQVQNSWAQTSITITNGCKRDEFSMEDSLQFLFSKFMCRHAFGKTTVGKAIPEEFYSNTVGNRLLELIHGYSLTEKRTILISVRGRYIVWLERVSLRFGNSKSS